MKTRFIPSDRSSAGNTLLLVMCITVVMLIMLAATLNRTMGTTTLDARNNQYQAGLYAAEAATEKVYAMMRADFLAGQLAAVTNDLALYRQAVPTANESAYWAQYQFSDGQGNLNSTFVSNTLSAYQLATNWGALPSQYAGLSGWTNNYRIISNAKQISGTTYNMTSACQLDVGLDLIPLFEYAIFYNSLLEFTWCAPMTINGRTHANGNIYDGSISSLTFNGLVTTIGTISSPTWDGHGPGTSSTYSTYPTFNANYSTNVQALTLPLGTTNVHSLIDMPTNGAPVNSALGQQQYYNIANLVLLVSNATVTLTLQSSPGDPQATNITAFYSSTNSSPTNYVQVTTNFPFLTLTNTFTDQRESDTVKVSDIDMGLLQQWLLTNKVATGKFPFSSVPGVYTLGTAPDVLYAADNRTYSSSQLTAVRLKNGTIIPTNMVNIAGVNQPTGFTVATPNPLYVWGNYNCPNAAYLNTTNTTTCYPASLASDALTILSGAWVDSASAKTMGSSGAGVRTASSDTVNAAILTGIVPSTGSGSSQFSGGVHNLPRLLEDWGNGTSQTLTLNTSIVNLFASIYATSQFQNPGVYYYAPIRQFSFNQNFLNYTKQPPGTPMLGYVLRNKWTVPPPNTVTYNGN